MSLGIHKGSVLVHRDLEGVAVGAVDKPEVFGVEYTPP